MLVGACEGQDMPLSFLLVSVEAFPSEGNELTLFTGIGVNGYLNDLMRSHWTLAVFCVSDAGFPFANEQMYIHMTWKVSCSLGDSLAFEMLRVLSYYVSWLLGQNTDLHKFSREVLCISIFIHSQI